MEEAVEKANISFPKIQYNPDNGALEAIRDCFVSLTDTKAKNATIWADWLLSEMWLRGFTLVKSDEQTF